MRTTCWCNRQTWRPAYPGYLLVREVGYTVDSPFEVPDWYAMKRERTFFRMMDYPAGGSEVLQEWIHIRVLFVFLNGSSQDCRNQTRNIVTGIQSTTVTVHSLVFDKSEAFDLAGVRSPSQCQQNVASGKRALGKQHGGARERKTERAKDGCQTVWLADLWKLRRRWKLSHCMVQVALVYIFIIGAYH